MMMLWTCFLYTVLLTGSSLLHLTNITYVHNNDQKYINVCLSVESSPKDGLEKGESLMMCALERVVVRQIFRRA